jgi:hypothetical protein
MITTTGINTNDHFISTRKCSEPNENLKQILDALKANYRPFRNRKSVVHKTTPEKNETLHLRVLPPS